MQESGDEKDGARDDGSSSAEGDMRPQQGGEAETTRFGMEEGDNTDVPATGEATRNQEVPEGSS